MKITFPELSVDLLEAAKRSDGVLSELSESELLEVKEKYLRFWYLVKKYPTKSICPTFDIDEMWHLHILHPIKYYNDCMNYFGCILDHNPGYGKDDNELPHLLDIYSQSKNIWFNEFNSEYNTNISNKIRLKYLEDSKNVEAKTCYNTPIASNQVEAKTCYNTPIASNQVEAKTCYNTPIASNIKEDLKDKSINVKRQNQEYFIA